MSRRLVPLTLDNLGELPVGCRSCVFWELDPVSGERAAQTGGAELEKEAWLSDTLLEWGSCGRIAYVDSLPAGYVVYAPPLYVPRSSAFATSPPSKDAVLLMIARVLPEFAGAGLGRMLVQAVAADVARRGLRAVEAFGSVAGSRCVLPSDFLRSVGFKTVRRHPQFPRLRLDIKSTASWREDVEYAIDRLLGTIQTPALAPR